MEIHHDESRLAAELPQDTVGGPKRAVNRGQRKPPLELEDSGFDSSGAFHHNPPSSWIPLGVVCRAEQPGLLLQEFPCLTVFPDVISRCNHVGSQLEELLKLAAPQPAPVAGSILSIDDQQVNPPPFSHNGKPPSEGFHPLPPDDIPDEEHVEIHARCPTLTPF
jgi:hypothetical protein